MGLTHRFRATLRGSLAVLVAVLLAGPIPAARACSKTGKLVGLMRYVGTNYGDLPTTLDADPAVRARLRRLPLTVREHLKRNLDVRGPVDLVGCHLVLSGNAPHMGGEENAIMDVNLYAGAVTAAILSHGHISIYLDQDPTTGRGYDGEVPRAVRQWAALAANGFRAEFMPPANMHVEHYSQ